MEYEILDSISDHVLIIDREHSILFANSSFLDICTEPNKDIIGKKCHEIFCHCSSQCTEKTSGSDCPLDCPHQEVLETGRPVTTCHTHFLPNGMERIFQISSSPVYDSSGKISKIVQVMRDVTSDKSLERLIHDAKREWECAMDASEDAMYLMGTNRCLLRANKAFFSMVGHGPEEVIGKKIEYVLHPEGEEVQCAVCKAYNEKRDDVIILEADHPGNPSTLPLEVTVRVVRDEEGLPISIFVRLHDLTAQRKTQSELQNARDEWERTFNAIADIVTLQNRDLQILKVNRKACEELGLPCDMIIGRNCYELFHGSCEPCEKCPLLVIRETLEPCTKEITNEKLGKTYLVSASPVMDDRGNLEYIVHVAKDITAQKKIEERLFQAQKMEAVGTLAGGIAHDFNNILSSIIGFAEFVKEEVAVGSQAEQDIDQVISSGLRAKDLVRQLLDFSRRSPRKPERFSPVTVVKEAMKMLRSTIPASITIVEDLDSKMGTICADPIGLQQIILNLCTNSMHAIEHRKGSIIVQLRESKIHEIEVSQQCAAGKGPFIVLTVRDTGCGMDRDTLDRIFEPYFTTKEPGKGSGMGLAVVHGIVHDCGGCIHVDSTPGKGSVFSIYFPDSGTTAPSDTPDAPVRITRRASKGSERIMVVDDEPLLVKIHKRQLERQGYSVVATTDSREALELVRSRPDEFYLLVTDQTMPGLTGIQLAEEIMKIKPAMPIILCTGHSDILSEEQALDFGIRRYVSKPIHKNELIDAVREVLDEEA